MFQIKRRDNSPFSEVSKGTYDQCFLSSCLCFVQGQGSVLEDRLPILQGVSDTVYKNLGKLKNLKLSNWVKTQSYKIPLLSPSLDSG